MNNLDSLTPKQYFEGIKAGDHVLLARAITLLESISASHRNKALEILEYCLPISGNSLRIGITGAPGVGKSSIIETLGLHIVNKGHRLAVLAVDPSSKKSKGSILGDKTRMQELSKHPNAYIRPTASGTHLGGVASATRETIIILEAAGFDTILVETVGVGQSETAVHGITDLFILLLLAGAGDELQGIKRGIMEMADIIVVNKADGDNIAKSRLAMGEVTRALHLFQAKDSGWTTSVDTCSALTGDGINALWEQINNFRATVKENGFFEQNRRNQHVQWFNEYLNTVLLQHIKQNERFKARLAELQEKIEHAEMLPPVAVQALLNALFPG